MMMPKAAPRFSARLGIAFAALAVDAGRAHADPPAAAAAVGPLGAASSGPLGSNEQDESLLGTVEVNGSAGGQLPPLPKLAVVPVITTGSADSVVNLVVRRDLDLSGQFDVQDLALAPAGPFTHDSPLDLQAFREKGAEYVVRVFAEPAPNNSIRTELAAEAYVTPARSDPSKPASQSAPTPPRPSYRGTVQTATTEIRSASHRLVDLLLGALTGKPGGFASHMVYAEKVGRWRRIFALDSDGFDLQGVGPTDATAISPAFGPGGQVFYALSRDYSPFQLAFGPSATPVPVAVPGSILGLAFSADHARLGLTVMDEGRSGLWIGDRGRFSPVAAAPYANHPVFSPTGKMAYVGGNPVQRIVIDAKPVSPSGFMASAPVFCDTPQGLLVVFTVGVGSGADIIATDTGGGSVRRLTRHEGANTSPACSPDGRLIAFFSTGKIKRASGASGSPDDSAGAGLFVMPIARPWLAKKISNEVGDSLHWEALEP